MITSVKIQKIKTSSIKRLSYEHITDYDGNQYRICKIGTQIWTTSNLKTTHYNNGDVIPYLSANGDWASDLTGAYCYPEGNIANIAYGILYNWFAVNHASGLALPGWRIPTDADFTTLTTYLGGLGVAGGILKEIGFDHWDTPNTGALDSYGFAALGANYRGANGTYYALNQYGFLWSGTALNATDSYARALSYNNDDVVRNNYDKNCGYSVRCVKDI